MCSLEASCEHGPYYYVFFENNVLTWDTSVCAHFNRRVNIWFYSLSYCLAWQKNDNGDENNKLMKGKNYL